MKYNLRSICKIGNRITREGVDRASAFRRAWQAAKQGIIEKVVGVKYSNRQNILQELDHYSKSDIKICVERDRGNPWDDNAVAVFASLIGQDQRRVRIGYLNSKNAAIWANLMDQGVRVSTVLQEIVGGWDYDIAYGLRIRLMV